MANKNNLIPQAHVLTVDEQSKGGKKSGEVRRENKMIQEMVGNETFQKILEKIVSMYLKNGKHTDLEKTKSFEDFKGKNPTVKVSILVSLVQKALKGDIRAIELLLAILGESPSIKIEADINNTNSYDQLSVEELRALARKCEADEQGT